MERKRRARDSAGSREPRRSEASPRRPASMVDAILELQAAAGNRAVAASLSGATAQREPEPAGSNDGGDLTLDSGETIPLQSASWSLKRSVKKLYSGNERNPEIVPAKREVGELVVTRTADEQSSRIQQLLSGAHERGSLRLVRPSRDGALPATTLSLREVSLTAYGLSRDKSTETLTIAVGDLQVAGMGKEASNAEARGFLEVVAGADAWPPVPVTSWELNEERALPAARAGGFEGRPNIRQPAEGASSSELVVEIGAGMGATRLAEALDQGRALDVTVSPVRTGRKTKLLHALVVGVSSTGGANVIKVRFIPEIVAERGSGSGPQLRLPRGPRPR